MEIYRVQYGSHSSPSLHPTPIVRNVCAFITSVPSHSIRAGIHLLSIKTKLYSLHPFLCNNMIQSYFHDMTHSAIPCSFKQLYSILKDGKGKCVLNYLLQWYLGDPHFHYYSRDCSQHTVVVSLWPGDFSWGWHLGAELWTKREHTFTIW